MNIAVVDDEKIIREEMERLVWGKEPDCQIGSFESGEELLLAGKPYDIVFLDIQMEGPNGIDTAKIIRQKWEDTVLIFVTGKKDYVFQAFDVAAFHYLLKPVRQDKFEEVFGRALQEAKRRKKEITDQLLVRTGKRTVSVSKGSILYVESRGKKAEIHTGKETMEIYASLSRLQTELGAGFYRCHRGYLVNMAYVSEYCRDGILLTDGGRIYLAKEKYPEFVKEYMRYLKGGGISYG